MSCYILFWVCAWNFIHKFDNEILWTARPQQNPVPFNYYLICVLHLSSSLSIEQKRAHLEKLNVENDEMRHVSRLTNVIEFDGFLKLNCTSWTLSSGAFAQRALIARVLIIIKLCVTFYQANKLTADDWLLPCLLDHKQCMRQLKFRNLAEQDCAF